MTFDFTDNSSPDIYREPILPAPQNHAALLTLGEKRMEICDEEFEKQRWENEGGADSGRADSIPSDYGVAKDNPIIQMVDDAFDQLDDESFDTAVQTITHAVEHAVACQAEVKGLVRYAIDRLSTLGHPADPPHPGALRLIKQRHKLAL